MKIIRKSEVCSRCGGVSGMTIDRWEAKGGFPKRVQLGANSVGWYEAEIDEWLQRRRSASDVAA